MYRKLPYGDVLYFKIYIKSNMCMRIFLSQFCYYITQRNMKYVRVLLYLNFFYTFSKILKTKFIVQFYTNFQTGIPWMFLSNTDISRCPKGGWGFYQCSYNNLQDKFWKLFTENLDFPFLLKTCNYMQAQLVISFSYQLITFLLDACFCRKRNNQ